VLAQPEPLKQTLRAAFRRVTRDALFLSAYPAINTPDGQGYQKTVLRECAQRLRYYELTKRFVIDDALVKMCGSVVCSVYFFRCGSKFLTSIGGIGQLNARVAGIRTRAKEFTDKKVEGFYQLVGEEESKKRVSEYTKSVNYIYPGASVRFLPLFPIFFSDINCGADWNLGNQRKVCLLPPCHRCLHSRLLLYR